MPRPGYIGVFDRSHYEDVLIARVHGSAPPDESSGATPRSTTSNARLVDGGTTIIKCMLHISAEEQRVRLLARLDDQEALEVQPRRHQGARALAALRESYEIALERTNTEHAPWHVIPSDKKWFKDLAIGRLLHRR